MQIHLMIMKSNYCTIFFSPGIYRYENAEEENKLSSTSGNVRPGV